MRNKCYEWVYGNSVLKQFIGAISIIFICFCLVLLLFNLSFHPSVAVLIGCIALGGIGNWIRGANRSVNKAN